jgi:organic hydroperoxide reductase OsmC/OhrA
MTIKDRRMRFTEVTLHPRVVIAQANAANVDRAVALHHEAHDQCFIANSVNFEVRNEPVVTVAG